MRYAGIINNDVVNGQGVCVSFWSQGCPHRCPQCHNPNTWDYNGGIEGDEQEIIDHIIEMISKNGIQRNLSILGGEPLCDQNLAFTSDLIIKVKEKYSNIKIFVWTGYLFEDLIDLMNTNHNVELIICNTDIIVDGKFVKELRDISLPLRGSTNQRVIDVKNSLKEGQAVFWRSAS